MHAGRQTIPAAALGVAGLALAGGLAGCGNTTATAATTPVTTPATTSPAPTGAATTATPSTTATTPATTTSAADPHLPTLVPYANARFGFTVSHPGAPDTLEQQPPPEDGDGLVWSTGGVAEQAYGDDNVNHETTAQVLADASKGVQVTYQNVSGNRVVVSGLLEGSIVYRLNVVGAGSIDTLQWSYPTSLRSTWDPVCAATANAFRAGDVATAH